MTKEQLIKKIIQKKEFSRLPKKDVELAFERFDKSKYCDEEKVKLTREVLHKVFGAFVSKKILNLKDKDSEWILRKHLSTRERLPYFDEVYKKILKGADKDLIVIDLGAGVNGFSYNYMKKFVKNLTYVGIEAMGQLVDLMNYYFIGQKKKFNAKAVHLSLFELQKIKKMIREKKGRKIIFLFKTIDSLEILEKDYSKKLLSEIVPLVDRVVVSFATRSFVKRIKFKVRRDWILNFIKKNFKVIEDFEIGGERYVVFSKR